MKNLNKLDKVGIMDDVKLVTYEANLVNSEPGKLLTKILCLIKFYKETSMIFVTT